MGFLGGGRGRKVFILYEHLSALSLELYALNSTTRCLLWSHTLLSTCLKIVSNLELPEISMSYNLEFLPSAENLHGPLLATIKSSKSACTGVYEIRFTSFLLCTGSKDLVRFQVLIFSPFTSRRPNVSKPTYITFFKAQFVVISSLARAVLLSSRITTIFPASVLNSIIRQKLYHSTPSVTTASR